MDRLRALEVFIAVADTGSLAAAARHLSLSAPTVTRILGEFEADLGALLFHRTTRALTLTEPGQNFLANARQIVGAYQEASDAVRGAHRAPTGLLRITAPNLFGQYYLLPIMMDFMDLYPDIRVEAIFLDRIVNIVEEGIDLALRIGHLADSSLIAVRVGAVRRMICATRAYLAKNGRPERPEDLTRHQIIAATPMGMSQEWQFQNGPSVKLTPRLSVSSIPAGIAAAKSDWGVTQVLSYQVGPEMRTGQLISLLEEYLPDPIPIHLVHAEGRGTSAKVRSFVDFARDRLRKDPYLDM